MPPVDIDLLDSLAAVAHVKSPWDRPLGPFGAAHEHITWNDMNLCACPSAPPPQRAHFAARVTAEVQKTMGHRRAVHLLDLGSGGMLQLAIQAQSLLAHFDTLRLTVVEPELPALTCGRYVVATGRVWAEPRQRQCGDRLRRPLRVPTDQRQLEQFIAFLRSLTAPHPQTRVELEVYQSAGVYIQDLEDDEALAPDVVTIVDVGAPAPALPGHGNLMVATHGRNESILMWLPHTASPQKVYPRTASSLLLDKMQRLMQHLPDDVSAKTLRRKLRDTFQQSQWFDDAVVRGEDLCLLLQKAPIMATLDSNKESIATACSPKASEKHRGRVLTHLAV